ncbi:LytR/AlgR family response regulator transcription factor [Flavivirga rizhaonensis]|uniref:Response regulator transcription factor n=1 Tax=Flavivirga rizhaonensis TaxID=2559571 RepID=A0A4S1E273_9FLAO|nr:LytTR family DNA-binding domain-containing protein [Flavivirga rizhaonensis]TGV04726.1 response regulator transcription factor [Flavivirga rizhaonensis]
MKTKCLIIDDEPLACALIANYVSKIPQLEVLAICHNALEAFEILKVKRVDLLFLDIQMPTLTGIDFLKSLSNTPKVILTTAYREYALESYELEVLDYLLKPIPFERFFQAIDKYFKSVSTQSLKTSHIDPSKEAPNYLQVNMNKKHHRVLFNDIIYAESLKDYVRIHTSEEAITTKEKISVFESMLPPFFIRTHRSYIVNSKKITAFTNQDIELGNIEIPIGISYKHRVFELLKRS